MYSIELSSINSKLILNQVNDIGWCQLFLLHKNKNIELGADNIRVVIKKILAILESSIFKKCSVNYQKEKYVWVMSLSEKHISVYARKVSNEIELLFISSSGKAIASLTLTKLECKNWICQLKKSESLLKDTGNY